jgi:hypothetical protein
LSGGGGTFGDAIRVDDLRLPEALSIKELEASGRIERGALKLTWTGHGGAPLHVSFAVNETVSDTRAARTPAGRVEDNRDDHQRERRTPLRARQSLRPQRRPRRLQARRQDPVCRVREVRVEPPTLEEMCPGYLAEACGGCTEYFDCVEKQRTCGPNGLT